MPRDRGEPIGYQNGLPVYKRIERKTPLGSREPKPRVPSKSKALRASERLLKDSTVIVKRRSRGVCERCLAADATQVHHRLPRGAGGSAHRPEVNMPANLLDLCLTCHAICESERERAYLLGLLVHRGQRPSEIPVTVGLEPFTHRFLLDDDGGKTVVESEAA